MIGTLIARGVNMFIKYGAENHLSDLMTKGEIYLNPCKYFRALEREQMLKGIGDGKDGGITLPVASVTAKSNESNQVFHQDDVEMHFIVESCATTPIFCLRRDESEFITHEYRELLADQFPKHTHALIIRDEEQFLENIRYNFKSRAFAHDIFYQDRLSVELFNFWKKGESDIRFYAPRTRNRYYAKVKYMPIYVKDSKIRINEDFYIDDSNCYRTMFAKSIFFEDQKEYRIVFPYEELDCGKKYTISQFDAELVKIDSLVE